MLAAGKEGRPFKVDEKKAAMVKQLLKDPDATMTEVSKVLGVSPSTLVGNGTAPAI